MSASMRCHLPFRIAMKLGSRLCFGATILPLVDQGGRLLFIFTAWLTSNSDAAFEIHHSLFHILPFP